MSNAGEPTVHLTVRVSDTKETKLKIEKDDLAMSEVPELLRGELVKLILRRSRDDDIEVLDRRQQIQKMGARAYSFSHAGAWSNSTGLREAVLLLDPENDAQRIALVADYLVPKSVWLLGGDGWAYDIGYGGLDHVLSLRRNVNALVLDTQVYSNTGGQASKATPIGAAAKFASAGKEQPKKPLGLEAITFRTVYVARIAFGANMNQTVQALREAESYPGPSLVVAYSPCIAHGYDLSTQVEQQKRMVKSGGWALYRYDPRRVLVGQPPLKMDSKRPTGRVNDYMKLEARFRMVEKMDPVRYRTLLEKAQDSAYKRWAVYEHLAGMTLPQPEAAEETDNEPS